MALNYSSKHDISYTSYNNKNIPWKLNASIISQNNQINNPSLNLGTINNNLVIESSQNDILFITSQNNNKKVIVKNNMAINNLDVSNNLTTNRPIVNDISLNNRFYFPSLPINIIGDLKVYGAINVIGSSKTGLAESETKFINSILTNSKFTDVSIVECNISDSSFSNVNIINSYIYNIPNGYGYDKSNNSYPNKAIFSDVSLDNLVLDSYINFDANASNSISIRSYDYDYDDYSKLVINKPLTVESGIRIGENISNISIFYGTISCNTLYYSQLVPDIRLNTYFDISIGQVSVSGNNIPVNNSFNIGSTNYKFNEIISTNYDGNLSGTATSANDLVKNLDMSFNNLDIYGTITLNRQNLNQFLSSDLLSINAAIIDFSNANKSVRDLSASLYSKAGFDLCLNTNFTKNRLVELSFTQLNNRIISISNIVYTKSDFDLCLNRNVLRTNDLSAIVAVVTNPGEIYPTLGYIDSSLNKVTNAKVTNELAFPYAITYIDDLVEDTNIRESLARIVSSQDGSIVVNATAIGVSYEINTNVQNWEWHRTNAISLGRSLAVILNAEQNERVRLVNVAANIGSTFIGALRTSKPNPPNLNNTSEYWQWTNGARWSYTNFGGYEPNNSGSGEPYVELYSNGLWNDIYTDTTRPAVYMNTLSIGNGSFKISENNNNKSYYIKSSASALPSNISTSYSCIAITNDGMFVALGKASNITVYMKNASGWTTLGDQINVDFTRYTDTCCNILWDTYDPAMYSNLQNLAINFNYNTGSTSSQLILAFGNTRTSIVVYSYTGGTWSLSNGIYSVTSGSWGATFLRAHNATTAEINNNNFGYFVTLSQSPSVLGFTVANKFYTYNCTNSDGSQRGSVQTLPSSNGSYTNIIAFKMSSDAEKIIVSNTYYVFVYKWNINNWSLLTTINLVSANITASIQVFRSTTGATVSTVSVANYPATVIESETPAFYEPFSAAINFDGTIIASTRGSRNADIIQVWKYINNTWTQLASPSPPGMSYYPELSNDGTICVYTGGTGGAPNTEWHTNNPFVEVRRYNNTTFVWDQIFKRYETNWARHERCTLSKDGKVLVITNIWRGADGTENNIGYINVYKYVSDMNWTPMGQTLSGTATMTNFATGVALSHTGDFMVCSTRMYSSYRGIARIYRFNTPVANNWNLIGEITGPVAGKSFGWQQAAMSSNGQIISIGSFGTIYVYKYISDMNWTQIGAIRGPNIYDEHFYFPTLSSDGTVVGLGQGGSVATTGDIPFVGNRYVQLWKYVNSVWTLIYDSVTPYQARYVMVAALSGNGKSFFISFRDGVSGKYPIVYNIVGTSYTIYSFKTIGSYIFVPAFSGTVQVLLVGGGGGGGSNSGLCRGGGGGGGGVVYMPNVSVINGQRYNIVVGGGGLENTNGQDTTAFGAIAAGGGSGGVPVGNGGSGGGASADTQSFKSGGISFGNTTGPNSGTTYGNSGGNNVGYYDPTHLDYIARGAGGGGAGSSGTNTGIVDGQLIDIGNGGAGVMHDILGPEYYWGGGGGGANLYGGGGRGGKGGGGGGSVPVTNEVRAPGGGDAINPGTPGGNANDRSGLAVNLYNVQGEGGQNTGGGGGGAGFRGGSGGPGGSGIIIIRHLQTLPQSSSSMLLTFNIPAGPRSLDISNISSDECVFAIGFPDKVIDTSANRKARGYVEYWKYSNPTLTRLATLVPRKRNIDSSNIDIDEYFFSGGGIKITNANTILVAPNFKFHFNNNNKNYTLDTSNVNWANHNSNARNVSGREMASIENEADNELVKISARNNVVWIGAKRTALDASSGITSAHWQWSDLSSIWNYTSFASGQPNSFSEKRIQSASGSWYDTLDSATLRAVYMTRLQYSLNTFSIFDKFYFHSSGFSSSYANTAISSTVIAKWTTTDTLNRSIDFKANGSIVSNGKGIFTISDIRLKENIVDSTPKLEDLLKVRVVNYNLKGCKDNKLIGVVAQELEQVFPTLVNDGELSMHDIYLGKTESYKSVKYSCFDVILIKAFQEHVAIINKLTSQLDEIDSKTKLLKAINKDYFILKQELDLLKSENELFKLNINEILKLI